MSIRIFGTSVRRSAQVVASLSVLRVDNATNSTRSFFGRSCGTPDDCGMGAAEMVALRVLVRRVGVLSVVTRGKKANSAVGFTPTVFGRVHSAPPRTDGINPPARIVSRTQVPLGHALPRSSASRISLPSRPRVTPSPAPGSTSTAQQESTHRSSQDPSRKRQRRLRRVYCGPDRAT